MIIGHFLKAVRNMKTTDKIIIHDGSGFRYVESIEVSKHLVILNLGNNTAKPSINDIKGEVLNDDL